MHCIGNEEKSTIQKTKGRGVRESERGKGRKHTPKIHWNLKLH